MQIRGNQGNSRRVKDGTIPHQREKGRPLGGTGTTEPLDRESQNRQPPFALYSGYFYCIMLHINSAKATPSQQDIQLLTPFIKEGLNIHQLEEVKAIFDSFDLTKTGLVQPKGIYPYLLRHQEGHRGTGIRSSSQPPLPAHLRHQPRGHWPHRFLEVCDLPDHQRDWQGGEVRDSRDVPAVRR